MKGEGTHAWVGLRSGNVLEVEKRKDGSIRVDASKVQLTDVAYGIAGLPRFQGQLWRDYSVAEHSVVGSYLTNDPLVALQFLFHDSGVGVGGVSDIHFRVKRLFGGGMSKVEDAIVAALAEQFKVPHPFEPAVKDIDRKLSDYEWLTLHPAKSAIEGAYGLDMKALRNALTPTQLGRLDAWFARDGNGWDQRKAAQEWLRAVDAARTNLANQAIIAAGVKKFLDDRMFWPRPIKVAAGMISYVTNFPLPQVEAEIAKAEARGELERRDVFFHRVEPKAPEEKTDAVPPVGTAG
jgi:hypothetical protein